jgi:hypothetical protein
MLQALPIPFLSNVIQQAVPKKNARCSKQVALPLVPFYPVTVLLANPAEIDLAPSRKKPYATRQRLYFRHLRAYREF